MIIYGQSYLTKVEEGVENLQRRLSLLIHSSKCLQEKSMTHTEDLQVSKEDLQ